MDFDGVILWGRSYAEYRLIFNLREDDLRRTILGCGDGPASFNAEATRRRCNVVSCDPVYVLSGPEIERVVLDCAPSVVRKLNENRDSYHWDYFNDPEDLAARRLAALQQFLADYDEGKANRRYVESRLPGLEEFRGRRFDMVLVSHVLFLYSDEFSRDFHLAAMHRLRGLADEVRVFPVVSIRGGVSPHLDAVIDDCSRNGWDAELEKVDYHFQKGANQMLRARRLA